MIPIDVQKKIKKKKKKERVQNQVDEESLGTRNPQGLDILPIFFYLDQLHVLRRTNTNVKFSRKDSWQNTRENLSKNQRLFNIVFQNHPTLEKILPSNVPFVRSLTKDLTHTTTSQQSIFVKSFISFVLIRYVRSTAPLDLFKKMVFRNGVFKTKVFRTE